MPEDSHCDTCRAYEDEVMGARAKGLEPDASRKPCDDYAMGATFQAWVVENMRDSVMEQVSGAGLDRMAILRSADEEDPEQE